MLQIKVPLAMTPARRKWPTYVAAAAIAASLATGIVGVVMIALSKSTPPPTGVSRAFAIKDSNDRFVEGRVGIGLLAGAGGFAATAALLAIVFRRDMFGVQTREPERRASLDVAPTIGGALVTATVRW